MKLFITAFLIFFAVPAAQGACGRAGVGGDCPNSNTDLPPGTPEFGPDNPCYGIIHDRLHSDGPGDQNTDFDKVGSYTSDSFMIRAASAAMGMTIIDVRKAAELIQKVIKDPTFFRTVSLPDKLTLDFLTQQWSTFMIVIIYNTIQESQIRGIPLNPLIAQAMDALLGLARGLWAQEPLAGPLRGAFLSLALVLNDPVAKNQFLGKKDSPTVPLGDFAAAALLGMVRVMNGALSAEDQKELNNAIKSVGRQTT